MKMKHFVAYTIILLYFLVNGYNSVHGYEQPIAQSGLDYLHEHTSLGHMVQECYNIDDFFYWTGYNFEYRYFQLCGHTGSLTFHTIVIHENLDFQRIPGLLDDKHDIQGQTIRRILGVN